MGIRWRWWAVVKRWCSDGEIRIKWSLILTVGRKNHHLMPWGYHMSIHFMHSVDDPSPFRIQGVLGDAVLRYGGVLSHGGTRIIHVIFGCSILNPLFFAVPPFQETSWNLHIYTGWCHPVMSVAFQPPLTSINHIEFSHWNGGFPKWGYPQSSSILDWNSPL